MTGTGNSASIRIPDRTPAAVFAFLTDVDLLPTWNDLIADVAARPATMEPGAEWKVAMQQGRLRWVSRSTVVEHDPTTFRFVHRSGTDDGNPSYAEWRWTAAPDGDGTVLTVAWHLHPRTRLRRWLMAPMRARRLRSEVPTSLDRLRQALDAHEATRRGS